MAKPREIYNTPAPQAMGQMGAGIAESYGRAGEMMMRGYASAGESIGKGIASMGQAVGQAYGDYKKMQSQVKADSAAFDSFKDYLPAEFVKKQQALENDPSASLLDKQQFYQSAKGYLGAAIAQKNKMDQIEAEVSGRAAAAQAGKEPTPDLAGLGQGLRQVTGVAAPAPQQPAAPAMQFDVTAPVQKLQDFMSKKYGPDYKLRGIQASDQDVIDAGL